MVDLLIGFLIGAGVCAASTGVYAWVTKSTKTVETAVSPYITTAEKDVSNVVSKVL